MRTVVAADLPATPLPTPSGAFSVTLPHGYGICTTTCTIAVPLPTAAGQDFCVTNAVGASTAMTFTGISTMYYSKPDRSAYGTVAGSFTVTAAAGNQVCMRSADTTHWDITNITGAGTAN